MFTYEQSTGRLTQNSHFVGSGWAGQREGRNNPAMQDVHNIGPLPQGRYKIGKAYIHPHLGSVTMDLIPDPSNQMFNRSDFRIHGSAFEHPELSSEGCIIQGYSVRCYIDQGTDKDLEVIA